MIKKLKGEYCLFSKDGKKKLGCHSTRAKAVAQERAVMARKRKPFEFITLREMTELSPEYAAYMRKRGLAAVTSQVFFDPENDTAPGASREFLKQMFGLLKGRLTKKDFDDAVRKARAKAGGIMSGRKRKRAKERRAYAS